MCSDLSSIDASYGGYNTLNQTYLQKNLTAAHKICEVYQLVAADDNIDTCNGCFKQT